MVNVFSKFTVLFDEPFWVGIYERLFEGKLEACKITFGAEPKDYEVYDFLLENWSTLIFSPAVESHETIKTVNPKRIKREIGKQLQNTGIGTKAQQALKLQQEQNKAERVLCKKRITEEFKEKQFLLKQEKKKRNHRGK